MGLIEMSERDLQRSKVLSKVLERRIDDRFGSTCPGIVA
jgi:hypothetical protein